MNEKSVSKRLIDPKNQEETEEFPRYSIATEEGMKGTLLAMQKWTKSRKTSILKSSASVATPNVQMNPYSEQKTLSEKEGQNAHT